MLNYVRNENNEIKTRQTLQHMTTKQSLQIFEEKKVRTVWDEEQEKWYFSIVDVVTVLTDNDYQGARKYWNKLKQRLTEEGNQTVTNCHQLKMKAADGKMRLTDVADQRIDQTPQGNPCMRI